MGVHRDGFAGLHHTGWLRLPGHGCRLAGWLLGLRLDFGFWLSVTRSLVEFGLIRLDFAWIRLDFGWIRLDFRLIISLIALIVL